jgi:hypothetical protein
VVGRVLLTLGIVARAQGDLDQARSRAEESLAIFRTLGDPFHVGWALFVLGYVVGLQGEGARSDELLAGSLGLLRRMGARSHLAVALCLAGLLALQRGEHSRGTRLLGAAARRPELDSQLTVDVRVQREARIAAARSALGDARFDQLWAEGLALTNDETIALATTNASPAT